MGKMIRMRKVSWKNPCENMDSSLKLTFSNVINVCIIVLSSRFTIMQPVQLRQSRGFVCDLML